MNAAFKKREALKKALINPFKYNLAEFNYLDLIGLMQANGFNFLGGGNHRIVFALNESLVIKIPKNHIGVWANFEEFEHGRKRPDLVARSRFYGCSLVQVRVKSLGYLHRVDDHLTEDMKNLFDNLESYEPRSRYCGRGWRDYGILQAGFTNSGKLLAFDFNSK